MNANHTCFRDRVRGPGQPQVALRPPKKKPPAHIYRLVKRESKPGYNITHEGPTVGRVLPQRASRLKSGLPRTVSMDKRHLLTSSGLASRIRVYQHIMQQPHHTQHNTQHIAAGTTSASATRRKLPETGAAQPPTAPPRKGRWLTEVDQQPPAEGSSRKSPLRTWGPRARTQCRLHKSGQNAPDHRALPVGARKILGQNGPKVSF
jgi:hypothetical protein